jgi:hypothetical protein
MVPTQTGWSKRRNYEFGVSKWCLICRLGANIASFSKPATVEMAQGKKEQLLVFIGITIITSNEVYNEKGFNLI